MFDKRNIRGAKLESRKTVSILKREDIEPPKMVDRDSFPKKVI